MTKQFLNPYNFIATTGKINNELSGKKTFADLKADDNPVRHDYWLKDKYSGRFVCELECKTPLVVGSQQTQGSENQAGKVEPYKINGEIALPANSLRGMISAITETLSQSALRVLNNSTYSVRKEVGHGLSAIGQLKKVKLENGDWQWKLLPFCLPTIDLRGTKQIPKKWQTLFGKKEPLSNWLSAYIHGYEVNRQSNPPQLKLSKPSFLNNSELSCFHRKHIHLYYAKLTPCDTLLSEDVDLDLNNLNIKDKQFLLGQKIIGEPITKVEYDKLNESEKVNYTRGILFILGIKNRESEIPTTKKHEKFIPIPPENKHTEKEKIIPIQVIENFRAIVKQRAESTEKEDIKEKQLPFLPQGYRENKQDKTNYWEPEDGELVYFDIDDNGEITEISYSAIWRKKIDGTIYDAFNSNLLPWGNEKRNPETAKLTPAELLFGVVAEQKTNDKIKSYNFASRVKFSDAKALKKVELLPAQTLKILANPKPPSPALYFKSKHGGYLPKNELDLTQHKPNGRKFYLHHPVVTKNIPANQNWETKELRENLKQKLSCQLIPTKTQFYFHIDFDNLSWDELSLLEKSLNPDETFVHRLGMGKPLGLGSVKINICGLFFIDRVNRYKSLDAPRYSERHQFYQSYEWSDKLKSRYFLESQAVNQPDIKINNTAFTDKLIDLKTLTALIILGNPALTKDKIVSYPYTDFQSPNSEDEGFEWFVNNDKKNGKHDFLKPLANPLPTLDSN